MSKANKILYASLAGLATLAIIGSGFATWYFVSDVTEDAEAAKNVSLQVSNLLSISGFDISVDFPDYVAMEDPANDIALSYEEMDKMGLYDNERSGLLFLKETEASGLSDYSGSVVTLLSSIDSEFSFTISDKDATDGMFLFNEDFSSYEYCEVYLGAEILLNGVPNNDYLTISSGDAYDYAYDASTKTYGRCINDLIDGWTNTDGQTLSFSCDLRSVISLSENLKTAFETYETSDASKSFLKQALAELSEYGYDSPSSATISLNKVEIDFHLTITSSALH